MLAAEHLGILLLVFTQHLGHSYQCLHIEFEYFKGCRIIIICSFPDNYLRCLCRKNPQVIYKEKFKTMFLMVVF